MSKIRFVGLDVHADTIAVAVAEPNGEVRSHRDDPEPPGIDSQTGRQAGSGEAASSLLRSRADRVRSVLAIDAAGGELRGDRAVAGAGQSG